MIIKPLGNRLVIKREKEKEKTLSGIIVTGKKTERQGMGYVLEISEEIREKGLIQIGDNLIFEEDEAFKIDQADFSLFIVDYKDILAKVEE